MATELNDGDQTPVKLTFALSEEEIGPYPVSSEALWCTPENGNFRLKNIPFFLEGVSFDDIVSVVREGEHLHRISKVVNPSSNSTLWISIQDSKNGLPLLDALTALGCGVEGGVLEDYYAINVPGAVRLQNVLDLIDPALRKEWLLVDYPSIRHPAT